MTDQFEPEIIVDETVGSSRHIVVRNCASVCSKAIELVVTDGKVESVRFMGGCNGNTQGVAALVAGMPVDEAVRRLKGINCGGRGTSCPDQLARALMK
ncbi:MAG: TIGR03905 family TSCPD domain-containing protein [Bacteroidaceae bacterium]|nr:TIGR03905 family TSCPD domain-containing protein [Bacteroidaceae bacterium]